MSPRCLPLAFRLVKAAADILSIAQVELHGNYSLERMRKFHVYTTHIRWHRILFLCIATPIPCLVINIVLDFVPLAKPSAGRDANYIFWARSAVFDVIVAYWIYMQIGFLTPTLRMTRWRALSTSAAVAVACVTYDYMLAGFIPMPIPFMLLLTTPVFFLVSAIVIAFYFGKRLKNDATLRYSSSRAMAIIALQLGLTFVYPIFIYGFNSISPKYQTPYMILVPAIKVIARNLMSKLVGTNHDMKPEVLIFNIDCFNAVYVSLAMQKATTISTSLTVMLIDFIQGCISVFDVYQEFQRLEHFMEKLPAGHSLRGKTFLEVAIALDHDRQLSSNNQSKQFPPDSYGNEPRGPSFIYAPISESPNQKCMSRLCGTASVVPATINCSPNIADACTQHVCISPKRRAVFLEATRKLLFTTEFVILVEYTEVIMPIFYSLFMGATYHLPNRTFYSTIDDIDNQQLWQMVTSVLLYAALELVSLAAMDIALRRITGVSAMLQVGFVLDNQCVMVQSKLLSWVFYAVQNSLEHLGADFSFQFKWLRLDS